VKRYALAGLVLAACALGLVLHYQPPRAIGAAEAAKQKWEYKQVSMLELAGDPVDVKNVPINLNKLGDEGWELVAIAPTKDGTIVDYVFKRPK
jgi:hypothetical protein